MPIVGVSCSVLSPWDAEVHHSVFDPYVRALVVYAGVNPVLVPALGDGSCGQPENMRALLARLDGLVLTGSPSMVQPSLYDGTPSAPGTHHDPARDATTLPMIGLAITLGVPLLGICRGAQELNCVAGGTLHQAVHTLPGKLDHRAPKGVATQGDKYKPAHDVECTPNGWLEAIALEAGVDPRRVPVNSLHQQAIDRLGRDLIVEARSSDGSVEAIRVASAKSFALAVQWHPEWHVEDQPMNRALLERFGVACRARAEATSPGTADLSGVFA
ncbi:MAG: gamma-glutamyl-gamma-aminobutyrate hydrolase family protein [Phenylobacterium sp.]|uniref:gamma-glutamyl-gamma-aminobutyrate hydrolase family protein n=1 Tax=Phenylobacterium sp. TaxID=1871053 RepID=UPI0027362059|nr:gamma-glutamyl-gamma-aminobutyrate hydrolase family protein [Phenylobacterium sp.]MDP3745640.1 gamma-glutamyl-gamma-aminobutyrate hydrolase family protein [Phenylobacterium sp.]